MVQADEGHSARSIAHSLGHQVVSVSPELVRDQDVRSYCGTRAAAAYQQRRRRSSRPRKLVPDLAPLIGSGPALPLSLVSGADSRQTAATVARATESPREL